MLTCVKVGQHVVVREYTCLLAGGVTLLSVQDCVCMVGVCCYSGWIGGIFTGRVNAFKVAKFE